MKKTAKASFIIGIILLAFSLIFITLSFAFHGHEQVIRGYNYFYSLQINSSSTQSLKAIQLMVLGSTLMISGLLLFILTAIIDYKQPRNLNKEFKPIETAKKVEKTKDENETEANTQHYQNNIDPVKSVDEENQA